MKKFDAAPASGLKDKFNLLTLKPGELRFLECKAAELERATKQIHRAGEYYRDTGKLNAPLFALKVHHEIGKTGLIYGLRTGF